MGVAGAVGVIQSSFGKSGKYKVGLCFVHCSSTLSLAAAGEGFITFIFAFLPGGLQGTNHRAGYDRKARTQQNKFAIQVLRV